MSNNKNIIDCLVRRSMNESAENLKRARRNITAKINDLEPYDNTAICNLIDAVDNLLKE